MQFRELEQTAFDAAGSQIAFMVVLQQTSTGSYLNKALHAPFRNTTREGICVRDDRSLRSHLVRGAIRSRKEELQHEATPEACVRVHDMRENRGAKRRIIQIGYPH